MGQSPSRSSKPASPATIPPQHIHTVVMTPPPPESGSSSQPGKTASTAPKRTRKTRFVCVADTHNLSPYNGAFKVPKGDVLIHAGDMTKQGTLNELKKTLSWIERLVTEGTVEKAIIIPGNHELALDPPFYASHGHNWHNQHPQNPEECLELFSRENLHPNITFLNHASSHIILNSPTGPQTHFTVFGSPHTPLHSTKLTSDTESRRWAFQYTPFPSTESEEIWHNLPPSVDVLITHSPPRNHLDGYPVNVGRGVAETHSGCEALRKACWKMRPKLHVFGHVHEGRGAERVMWRDSKHVEGMEEGCGCSYLDENTADMSTISREIPRASEPKSELSDLGNSRSSNRRGSQGAREIAEKVEGYIHDHAQMEWIDPGAVDDRINGKMSVVDVTSRTRMFGGIGLREGETLMVNAAIVKGGWPYTGVNKALVVDLELEVWEEGKMTIPTFH